jgi:hypothetical protein
MNDIRVALGETHQSALRRLGRPALAILRKVILNRLHELARRMHYA